MQTEPIMREGTPKLNEALAKANLEIHNPSFDKENPHFRSRFASLAAVRNAVIPAYSRNGLSVIQDVHSTPEGVSCYTTLLHASGEEKTLGPFSVPATKKDAQGYAAAATYAKRVHLQAVACVVGDDDDDGESAVGRPETGATTLDRKSKADLSKKATEYMTRINEAVAQDRDVLELWDEVHQGGEEFATAVWAKLNGPIKDLIKDSVEKRRKAKVAA